MESIADKLSEAERLKQEGNQFFQQKDFKKALARYHQANLFLAGLQDKNSAYFSYATDLQLGEEQAKKTNELKLSIYLNMAQIYLFEEKYPKALDMYAHCQLSLKKAADIAQPPKLLYRRAIALMHTQEFEEARRDFNRVLELEPGMKADIEGRLKELRNLQRQSEKKLSGQFKKMFL